MRADWEQQQPCINVAEERFDYMTMVHVVSSTTEIQLNKTNHITRIFIKINEGKKVWPNHNRLTWNKSFSLLVDDLKDRRRDEMDNKKNSQRHKRQSKTLEENYWDCSVCTFRNTAEAFKCAMCDVRKGTSTRKPRLNPQLVAQQVAQQLTASTPKPRSDGSKERKSQNNSTGNSEEKIKKKKIRNIRPRLKNVDRSQVYRQPVTVNNVTVVITEFLPKSVASSSQNSTVLPTDIPSSSDVSNHSEVSVNGEVPPTPQSS